MDFELKINCDNDAFMYGRGQELARILRALADELEEEAPQSYRAILYDVNGNRVGEAKIKGEPAYLNGDS